VGQDVSEDPAGKRALLSEEAEAVPTRRGVFHRSDHSALTIIRPVSAHNPYYMYLIQRSYLGWNVIVMSHTFNRIPFVFSVIIS
jgi:hypothetical protein